MCYMVTKASLVYIIEVISMNRFYIHSYVQFTTFLYFAFTHRNILADLNNVCKTHSSVFNYSLKLCGWKSTSWP